MSQNDIEVRIGARTDGLQDGMARANRVIAESMSQLQQQFAGIGQTFSRLQGLIGGLTLGALAQQAVSTMSAFEQLQIRLDSVMGSAAQGQEAFAWIQKFAKDTPYQVSEVTQSFMLLKNMGLDPMDGSLQAIADQAAKTGGGFETLQRISLALGQAWTKGKLQGEEAMQLLEAGVPVWDMLAKVTGKTTAEIQALSEKGALGRDVIKALIDEIGRSADGAAVAQMQSLSGMWSNFVDNMEGALNRLRQDGALEPLKQMLGELNAAFERLDSNGTLAQWSADIASSLKAVGDGLMSTAEFVSEYGEQLRFLAEAYLTVKAAQAGSQMVGQLTEEMQKRVAAMAAAKEKAAADLAAANAASVSARQTQLLAESEHVAAQTALRRAAAQAESWQAALRQAQAETDLATRTRLTAQAQTELTAALDARQAATARAAVATAALNTATVNAAASTAAAATAQIAFERATTLAGLAARGFAAVMAALGGPLGIAIIGLIALVTHWDAVASAAGNAAAKSRQAAADIKQSLNDIDVSRMRQGLREATDEYNRLKLKEQTTGGNLTRNQHGLTQAVDNARGRMLQYQKGLDDVKAAQAATAPGASYSNEGGQRSTVPKSALPSAPKLTLSGGKATGRRGGRQGSAETSRFGDWQTQLDKQRLDTESSGGQLSQQQEAEFWAQKLAIAKPRSQEYEQVLRQHQRVKLAIARDGAKNAHELALAEIDIQTRANHDALAADEAAWQREAALNGLSHSQQEAALIGFEQRRLAIQKAAIEARIAEMERDPDHNIAEKRRLDASLEEAEREHQTRLAAIRGQSGAEQAAPGQQRWEGIEGDTGQLYQQGLERMLQGTLSFKQAVQQVWAEIGRIMLQHLVLRPATALAAKYTREVAQEGVHQAAMFAIKQGWLGRELAQKLGLLKKEATEATATELAKTGAVVAGETARSGAVATASGATKTIKGAEATVVVGANAAEAASGAAASVAAIPYVGWAMAAGVFAATMAMVMGAKSSIKSASGGYSIPRGLNPITQLHEEEMVLPRPYANAIRDMAAGRSGEAGTASNGNAGDSYAVHYNDNSGRLSREQIRDNARTIAEELSRLHRHNWKPA